jgi:hypothetical protein
VIPPRKRGKEGKKMRKKRKKALSIMRSAMLINLFVLSASACFAFAPVSVPGALQARVLSLEQV